ncbi:MAG: DUF167 domain-containing protein [Phycisphaerales bacterium]|nr:DUF167 domain-containing protein [Phycisphaerales bacterium]
MSMGVLVRVKVVPGASRLRLAGLLGDRLKIQVSAPPEDGKANAALCQVLAEALQINLRQVNVVEGHTRPQKMVRIEGLRLPMVYGLLSSNTARQHG